MIRYFLSIFIVTLSLEASAQGQLVIPFDSLRVEVVEAQNAKEKVDAYLSLGTAFAASRMIDSLFYYSEVLDTTNLYGLAGKYYLRGQAHFRLRKFREATAELEKSLDGLQAENEEAYFQALMTIGIIYTQTNENEKAIASYETILDNVGESEHPVKGKAYGNLAMAYRGIGDFNKAIDYLEQCVALRPDDAFSTANSYMQIASMFNMLDMNEKAIATMHKVDSNPIKNTLIYIAYNTNLGKFYFENNQIDSAANHFTISSTLAEKLNQAHMGSVPNVYLSKIAMASGNAEAAHHALQKATAANRKRPSPIVQIAIGIWAGEYFNQNNQPDSAIAYLKKTIGFAASRRMGHGLQNAYQLLSNAYELKGEAASSATYLKKHNAFTDSVNNMDRNRVLATARAKYEVGKTNEELKQVAEEKSFFKSMTMKISLVVLLLTGLTLVLYFKFFKQLQSNTLKEEEIKVLNNKLEAMNSTVLEKSESLQHLLLKSKAVIELSALTYVKSDGPYLEFYIDGKPNPEIDRNTLKAVIGELSSEFVQVHRSYIVNVNYIRAIYATKLCLKSGEEINISRSYKRNIENVLINAA